MFSKISSIAPFTAADVALRAAHALVSGNPLCGKTKRIVRPSAPARTSQPSGDDVKQQV